MMPSPRDDIPPPQTSPVAAHVVPAAPEAHTTHAGDAVGALGGSGAGAALSGRPHTSLSASVAKRLMGASLTSTGTLGTLGTYGRRMLLTSPITPATEGVGACLAGLG